MPNSPRRALEAVVYLDDRPLARCLVRRGRYIIGQEKKNEIVVSEGSVSGAHARLTIASEDEIYIEDLDSANGTFVNGVHVHAETAVPLDAEVRMGATVLCFERSGVPAAIFAGLSADFLRAQRYDVGDLVVQGSTSSIYEALDTTLGRTVAYKLLLPATQRDPAAVLRFIREAQITSQIEHSGILPVYELGLDESNQLFLTTRFIDSHPLADLLEQLAKGEEAVVARYTLSHLLHIWQKACDTVACAHARGVVHGALKPDAIQVARHGEVFVTNWHLARVLGGDAETPQKVHAPMAHFHPPLSSFSAPEQAAGNYDEIDARTDIHALGGLLYKIITLRDPLAGETEDQLLEAALGSKVTPFAQLPKDDPHPHWPRGRVPEFPAAVALKALSYAAEDRHQSVGDLQREIAAWQDGIAAGADLGKLWKQFTGLLKSR